MSVAFYTAIIGNYEQLREPPKGLKASFFCFTDSPKKIKKLSSSTRYEIIGIDRQEDDPFREARRIKILTPKLLNEFSHTVWVDASAKIKVVSAERFVEHALKDVHISVLRHPCQDGISGELQRCLASRHDDPQIMISQVARYYKQGMPDDLEFVATGVVVRDSSKSATKFSAAWWQEVSNHSRRDQLSFGYVSWHNKIKYTSFDQLIWEVKCFRSKWFVFYPHG